MYVTVQKTTENEEKVSQQNRGDETTGFRDVVMD